MLCTPPAFILSQDQTLEIILLYLAFASLQSFLSSCFLLASLTLLSIYNSLTRMYFALLFCFVLLSCCSIFNDHPSAFLRTALLLYHNHSPLSIPFFKLFSNFFKVLFGGPAVRPRGQLVYFTTPPSFCQAFFWIFSKKRMILDDCTNTNPKKRPSEVQF